MFEVSDGCKVAMDALNTCWATSDVRVHTFYPVLSRLIIVRLETVEGKAMAIDSSIWIYQFQATMRDKEGRALVNAHVLGFLRRISKLLFYGIKPVFVFDGGAPALKRTTLVLRGHIFHFCFNYLRLSLLERAKEEEEWRCSESRQGSGEASGRADEEGSAESCPRCVCAFVHS